MHEYAWLKRTKGQYRVIHLSVKIRRKQKMVKKLKKINPWSLQYRTCKCKCKWGFHPKKKIKKKNKKLIM